jgi:Domain of unknown function (DUF4188)
VKVIDKRLTAEIEGDFVVFLIGMRINKLWKPWKWGPTFVAMPRMIRELDGRPESGCLGARYMLAGPRSPVMVQYWRSFAHLEAYARSHDAEHWPAWVAFNKRVGSSGDVGIWHETYLVPAGRYECVYNNMPPTGLGAISKLVPAAGRKAAAASRAGVSDERYPAEAISGRIEV